MSTQTKTCTWTGKSGTVYEYDVYPLDNTWNEVPANYIMAYEGSSGYWHAAYIGETENLKERMSGHEKLPCAKKNGATHLHAHVNSSAVARRKEEQDLIEAFSPPCNG